MTIGSTGYSAPLLVPFGSALPFPSALVFVFCPFCADVVRDTDGEDAPPR